MSRFSLVAVLLAGVAAWPDASGQTPTDTTPASQTEAGLVGAPAGKGETAAQTSEEPTSIQYGPGRELCKLANKAVDESSGLACSRRSPGLFWTHNDSGDRARIYLFDRNGRDLGYCLLGDVFAYDWEDLVSFRMDGKSYLLVCDVGNNVLAAPVQMLHLVEEPVYDPDRGLTARQIPVVRTIYYAYEDDHRNCEAVAVDPTSKTILMVTKEPAGVAHVYALPWPEDVPNKAHAARLIATLKVPPVTSMDVSPDGRRAVVLTYGNAYQYVRGENEDWAKAFSGKPREIVMPKLTQREAICYGPDGKTLYLTSEKLPTPFWEIPVAEP